MRSLWVVAALSAAMVAAPAQACRINRAFDPAHVRQAEVVLVGRIVGYEVMPHLKDRSRARGRHYLGNYARLQLTADEVLVGSVSKRLAAAWINSTFALPASMPPGPYLIALRAPGAGIGVAEPDKHSVLQTPCSPAFILEASGEEAAAVRSILRSGKPATGR